MATLQKSKYLLQNLEIKQNMRKQKIATNYTFWKALHPANLDLQKHLQNFWNLNVYSRKTKNV